MIYAFPLLVSPIHAKIDSATAAGTQPCISEIGGSAPADGTTDVPLDVAIATVPPGEPGAFVRFGTVASATITTPETYFVVDSHDGDRRSPCPCFPSVRSQGSGRCYAAPADGSASECDGYFRTATKPPDPPPPQCDPTHPARACRPNHRAPDARSTPG